MPSSSKSKSKHKKMKKTKAATILLINQQQSVRKSHYLLLEDDSIIDPSLLPRELITWKKRQKKCVKHLAQNHPLLAIAKAIANATKK